MKFRARGALVALMMACALGAVAATPAFASGKPFAETKPATSVTEEGATLSGSVNPNGAEAKYYFEYGETTSYGKKTAEASAGSGTSSVEVGKAITGLSFVKTYYFRIVATNSNGTTYGSDVEFGRPAAETRWATSTFTSGTRATLHGSVDPTGVETKYWWEYGTEKGKFTTKTAETSAGSGTSSVEEFTAITGLTEGTKYYFRIVAKNGKGKVDGSEKMFTAGVQPEFALSPEEFKGTFGSSTFYFEGTLWSSQGGTISGKITDYNEVADVIMKFTTLKGTAACFNSETEGRELTTNELVGRLGYLNKAEKTVGLLLEPKSGPVATCTSEFFGSEEITGSVIGALTPVDKGTNSFGLRITRAGNYEQSWTKFEGEEVVHGLEDYWQNGKSHSKIGIEISELNLEVPSRTELKA